MLKIVNHKPWPPTELNDNAPSVLAMANLLPMKYWLAGGTLLGLYRDGDFIYGDTDIDVEVEGYQGVDVDIVEVLDAELIRTIYHDTRPMQLAFLKDENVFDVYVLWRVDGSMVNYNEMGVMKTPYHFYDVLETIYTEYGKYPAPSPINEYLNVRYGPNWQTPSKSKGLYTHEI
jgi:hypothetical protein